MAKRTSRRTGKGRRSERETPLLDATTPDDVDVLARDGGDTVVGLHEAAQARYLNYALSVITSRALPDVRDGLKPVQRRILYTMWQQRLRSDAKPRKCAKVVGDVMGSYHPHGDAAIYDTLVRMAQPFTVRVPLVDGSGNFGSLDGDGAAAMRYTECRLAAISAELLREIDEETVAFQPNYDGTRQEPVVLPARVPNLLVNGATGIAVGMATNIPPHNLGEIATALINLLDDPELNSARLARDVRGPDFPTGGRLVNTTEELTQIYTTGCGTVRVRATWKNGDRRRSSKTVHVTSVPYGVNKAQLVERIAEVVVGRKLPALLDVKDISADDVRIELELKADADERMVMAYLFKHTPLQTTFPVNLTCLVPTEQPGVGRPDRLDLQQMLWHFLRFRLDVVTRRPRARARRPGQADPHPGGVRKGLRRARRHHHADPAVGRQGGCGGEDHADLRTRRRADRRDPGAENLPPGAARDPDHPQGAGGEARAGAADRRRARRRGAAAGRSCATSWPRFGTLTANRAGRPSTARPTTRWYSAPTTSSSTRMPWCWSRGTAG